MLILKVQVHFVSHTLREIFVSSIRIYDRNYTNSGFEWCLLCSTFCPFFFFFFGNRVNIDIIPPEDTLTFVYFSLSLCFCLFDIQYSAMTILCIICFTSMSSIGNAPSYQSHRQCCFLLYHSSF